MTLRNLRILISALWLLYTAEILIYQWYDPTLNSPILHLSKNVLTTVFNSNALFYFLFVLESVLFMYACASLWFSDLSGRKALWGYIFLVLTCNYFLPVQAYSWPVRIIEAIYFLILGTIVLAIYTSPLRAKIEAQKKFQFRKIFGAFLIFFAIFFGLPFCLSFLES